jgi:hypothetical protein
MSTVDYGVQAVQLTADGVVTDRRSFVKQVVAFHPVSSDSTYQFYDSKTSSVSGLTPYTYEVYGKKTDVLPIPDPGILFKQGIYVTVPSGTTITVFFEEV